jgi:hypothetical protein
MPLSLSVVVGDLMRKMMSALERTHPHPRPVCRWLRPMKLL